MKKFNLKMAATVMICGSFLFSSCIGSFGLHSKLVSWNQGIGTKFVNELVYLAFNIIPVYGVCYLADAHRIHWRKVQSFPSQFHWYQTDY